MVRAAAIVAALLASATAAQGDCDHFKWSVAQEKTWFAQAPDPIDTGAEVAIGAHAYELALKPEPAVAYVEPLKTKSAGAFGAIVRVAALPKPGLYQATLSREAWVDIIQDGARARTRNVSRQRDCATFVKSVRFSLAAGSAVLQFSGVTAPSIAFALAPGE